MQSKSIFAVAAAVLSSAGLAAFSAPPALAQQTTVFFDDFDGGSGNIGSWGTLQNVSTTDPGSLFGSNVYYFDGSNSSDRFAETQALDLSEGRVQLTFLLRYEGRISAMGDSSDVPEFEKHDNLSDAVQVDYSTDGGANWTTAAAFGELNDSFRLGATATVNLPSAAWQSSVQIRLFQNGTNVNSGNDQWAVDDFTVLVNPEPGTWALFGLGTAALGAWAKRCRAARRRRPAEVAAATGNPPPDLGKTG